MKRLFIAANISEQARRYASGLMQALRDGPPTKGLSWTKPENLHVTINFLGDTDAVTEAKLVGSISSMTRKVQPFRLQFDKAELLGKRVISIAIRTDSPTIFSLEMAIDTECERLGYEREGRRFHPHLSLGRVRQPENARAVTKQFLQTKIEPLSFEIRDIVLYESELGPGGSIYKVVERFDLNG